MKIFSLIFSLMFIFFISGCIAENHNISYSDIESETEMMKRFAQGSGIIDSTIPRDVSAGKGSRVEFALAVKKSAENENYDYFGICVGTPDSDNCKAPGQEPVKVSGDLSGINFLFAPVVKIKNVGDVARFAALMEVPQDAKTGSHSFRFFVCSLEKPSEVCESPEDAIGYFDFDVNVK